MKGYKRLEVWKKAHELALLVYKNSKEFPSYEQFGLTSQLRRAAISVPANIVEGQASSSKKDFLNFLNIANRSLAETEYLLEVCRDLGYVPEDKYCELEEVRSHTGGLLNGLMRSVRNKL